jgi:hypothetical protein
MFHRCRRPRRLWGGGTETEGRVLGSRQKVKGSNYIYRCPDLTTRIQIVIVLLRFPTSVTIATVAKACTSVVFRYNVCYFQRCLSHFFYLLDSPACAPNQPSNVRWTRPTASPPHLDMDAGLAAKTHCYIRIYAILIRAIQPQSLSRMRKWGCR